MAAHTTALRRLALPAAVSLVALALTVAGAAQQRPWPGADRDPAVTPVSGSSWLHHLGLTLRNTWLGQGSGRYGPTPGQAVRPRAESLGVRRAVTLTGEDLYRLNCQACHRSTGEGAPPEIHSLLGPVQGSSLAIVQQRLREQHRAAGTREIQADARRAHDQILTRLHQGGTRMPPRDYLQDADMAALFAYLTQLAGTPDAQQPLRRTVSWARLGEITVKGTCHICHDAVGPRPTDAALLDGAIPSLQSLVASKTVAEFVRKARDGAVIQMGDVATPHRGRMPVFYYLTDEEIAAAYMYLSTYPPK